MTITAHTPSAPTPRKYARGVARSIFSQWASGTARELHSGYDPAWYQATSSYADWAVVQYGLEHGYLIPAADQTPPPPLQGPRGLITHTPYRTASGQEFHAGDYFVRTERPCKPYQPRPEEQIHYDGPFPWSEARHWARLLRAPWRQHIFIRGQLLGHEQQVPKWRKWATYPRWRPTSEHFRYPLVLHTRNKMVRARRALLIIFGLWSPEESTQRPHWRQQTDRPEWLTTLCSSPQGIRILCLELCCEPHGPTPGVVTHFRALPPEQAWEELQTQYHWAEDPATRYLSTFGPR